jgi:uncharacterized protein (TIGR02453 family)
MLQQSTIKFLKNLQKNNNRPWFEAHRKDYEDAKANFLTMVEKLIPGIASFDPTIADQQAKNCTFRINRDVRFSKNKSPYKNNMAAYFNQAGKKGIGAGYYLHIEPGNSFVAAGIWMPEPAGLAKIRQEMDYNLDEWKKTIGNASFKKHFKNGLDVSNTLARPPKGYAEDNPAIEYIKLKSFVAMSPITDDSIVNNSFVKDVVKIMQSAHPLVTFLNRAIMD